MAEAVVKALGIEEVATEHVASKGRNPSVKEPRTWGVRFRACSKAKGEKALRCP